MKKYIHRAQIGAPVESVAKFHRDANALRRLTLPLIIVKMHQIEPMAEGSKADFTLWIGLLPVRWMAVHSQVDALKGFTDTQLQGPFKSWVHQHSFIVIDENATEIRDEIEAEMAAHPFWFFVGWLMWLGLPVMFAYRSWVVKRHLEGKK